MKSKIRFKCMRLLFLAASVLTLSANSFALELAGIKLAESEKVATQDLKLNGAGIRTKAFFKIFVAGLYLSEQKKTTPEVIALPGAKRMMLVLLRDISNNDFAQAFMTGIQKNSGKEERLQTINSLMKFGEIFASVPEFKKGDIVSGDWVPGTGAVFQLNGKKIGEVIPDALFYSMFLKIWLGEKPADTKLKSMLLGAAE